MSTKLLRLTIVATLALAWPAAAEAKCDLPAACREIGELRQLTDGTLVAYPGRVEDFVSRFSTHFSRLNSQHLACRFDAGSTLPKDVDADLGKILRAKNSIDPKSKRSALYKEDDPAYRSLQIIRGSLDHLAGLLKCSGAKSAAAAKKTEEAGSVKPEKGVCRRQGETPNEKETNEALDFFRDQMQEAMDMALKEEAVAKSSKNLQRASAARGKYNSFRQVKGYWDNIKAASCMPPHVQGLLKYHISLKKAGRTQDLDSCAQLCDATAEWYQKMLPVGGAFSRKTFVEGCTARCN